ncbi:hypothetical protein GCM10017612_27660 [Novosphingobium resinovorum]|nr:hypothetical protein GCM10017612_27660 [Novosphingobium resinovorum]
MVAVLQARSEATRRAIKRSSRHRRHGNEAEIALIHASADGEAVAALDAVLVGAGRVPGQDVPVGRGRGSAAVTALPLALATMPLIGIGL